jgi:predicted helicase
MAHQTPVWLWRDWPGRWGADAGIDLVAETRTGGLWAIQAKAYDPSYSIKKADVDTFLAESARPQFDYRLIIATTNRIGATAKRTIDAQGVPVGLLLLTDVEKALLTGLVRLTICVLGACARSTRSLITGRR